MYNLSNSYEIDFLVQYDSNLDFYQGEVRLANPSENEGYYVVGSVVSGFTGDKIFIGAKDQVRYLCDSFITCNLDVILEHYNSVTREVETTKFLDRDFLVVAVGDNMGLIDKNCFLSKDTVSTDSKSPVFAVGMHNSEQAISAIKSYLIEREKDGSAEEKKED
ncbi:MAG: hypothetical protein ACTJLM_02585 [Ehrlichia sp.]